MRLSEFYFSPQNSRFKKLYFEKSDESKDCVTNCLGKNEASQFETQY